MQLITLKKGQVYCTNICNNYMSELNGYLGLSEMGDLGIWYNAHNVNLEVKLAKARCLVLERILPSYCAGKGRVSDLFSSPVLRLLRRFEHEIYRLWN